MKRSDVYVFAIDGVLIEKDTDMTKDVLSDFLYVMKNNVRFYLATELTLEQVEAKLPKEVLELVEGVFTEKNTKLYRKTLRETDGTNARWYKHEEATEGLYFNFDVAFYNPDNNKVMEILPNYDEDRIDKSDTRVYNKVVSVQSPVQMLEKLYKVLFGNYSGL